MGGGVRISQWALVAVVVLAPVWAISIRCGVCEEDRCPELHYCEGEAVKDHCGCCTVCSSDKFQPHPLLASVQGHGSACKQVECPKFKVCVENMQGLPLCTCPSEYICRRRRQRPLCGSDGRTYSSRCHLRIAACNSGTKIKVYRKGSCPGQDKGTDETHAEAPKPNHSPARASSGTSPPSRTCDTPTSCRRRKQRAVCGTDGRTHPSRCHMKIAACQEDVRIRVRHAGACTESGVASPYDHYNADDEEEDDDSGTSDVSVSRDPAPRKRKNNNGNDTGAEDDGKSKEDKERRNRRKRKKDMRRRRRKIRDRSPNRRQKNQKNKFLRTFGHFTWKY